jgi:hypothetical protein
MKKSKPITTTAREFADLPENLKEAHALYLQMLNLTEGRDIGLVTMALASLLNTLAVENASDREDAGNNLRCIYDYAAQSLDTAWVTHLEETTPHDAGKA